MCGGYAYEHAFQSLFQLPYLPRDDVLGTVMHLRLFCVPHFRFLLLCSLDKLVAIRGRLPVSGILKDMIGHS